MTYSDQHFGRQAAEQGLGMPANASLATQNAYNQEMARRNDAGFYGRIAMPSPPVSANGVGFLLLLPVLAAWFVFADLVYGWRRWRVGVLLLGVLITVVALAVGLTIDIRADLAGPDAAARVAGLVEFLKDAGTAGVCVVILSLIPRTILAVVAVVGVIQGFNTWIAPLL